MARTGTLIKWAVAAGVLGAAGAGAAWRGPALYARWSASRDAGQKEAAVRYYTVRRGELRVVVSEEGRLRAIKSHAIYPELRQSCKIMWLAADGARVKKGELLVTLDKKMFEDNLQARQGELENAQRQLEMADEAVKIERKNAVSTVAAARTRLADAQTALKLFKDMETPKRLADLENAIADAQGRLATATKALAEVTAKIDGELFMEEGQRQQLEKEQANARTAAEAAKRTHAAAGLARKGYRAYDYPQNLRVKIGAVDTAAIELEKAEVQANSLVLQKEAAAAQVRQQIGRLTRDIETLKDSLTKCEIKAPVDGLVVYGDPNQGYYGGGREIKVGMEWYGGNTLMTIPDLSAFEVDFSIAEEMRGRVTVGCAATVGVQAVPGLTLAAKVNKISDMGRGRTPWDPNSPKVYGAVLSLDRHDERLVSGMTAKVELVADVVPDVLLVPIEAVFNDNGKTVCYVRTAAGADKRPVTAGKCNDHFVEVTAGLSEGEVLDLTPPVDAGVAKGAG